MSEVAVSGPFAHLLVDNTVTDERNPQIWWVRSSPGENRQ
jgi:hypothetical protein